MERGEIRGLGNGGVGSDIVGERSVDAFAAALTADKIAVAISCDFVEPILERRIAAKRAEAAGGVDERLLRDVLGIVRAESQAIGERVYHRIVSVEECPERFDAAVRGGFQQSTFIKLFGHMAHSLYIVETVHKGKSFEKNVTEASCLRRAKPERAAEASDEFRDNIHLLNESKMRVFSIAFQTIL